jgi:hypothetical protein
MEARVSDAQEAISHISGGCRCGAISYEISLPPSLDQNSSESLKRNLITPSKQKFPSRGVTPNSNRWRANHCHCTTCRQTVGGLVVTWVSIPYTHIKIARNGPTGKYNATNRVTREFVGVSFITFTKLTFIVSNLRSGIILLGKGRS